MLIIILLAFTAATAFAEKTRYFEIWGEEEITQEEAALREHRAKTFDDDGNVTSESYFGSEGEAVARADGVHRFEFTYNENGNMTSGRTFGVDGEAVARDGLYHEYRREYDAQGHELSLSYFGVEGEPVAPGLWHRAESTYDARGNGCSLSYFGVDNEPATDDEGIHRYEYAYDADGNVWSVSIFGADRKPAVDKEGYFFGELSAFRHLQAPAPGFEGSIHRVEFSYDEEGRIASESYFGPDDEPVADAAGVHRYERQYNEEEPYLTERTYNVEGDLISAKEKGD
jgi:uncharacterized protein YkuJ